jgi:hypothetical protein
MNDSIRKLIDSCRPHGDDLGLPEMQPLADLIATDAVTARQLDRSRQLDDTIAIAVQEVPTPSGLEQRLLAALSDSATGVTEAGSTSLAESALSADLPADGTSVDKVVVRPQPGILRSRRLWMAVATCASVTVIVAFALNRSSGPNVSYNELVSAALNWNPAEEDWKKGNLIWKSHPLPKQIRATGVDQRQEYKLPTYGVRSKCYELKLKGGGGSKALVFVFAKPPGFALPNAPPASTGSTGGKCVAAWISGGLVYVLVVAGKNAERDYRDAVRSALQLTLHRPVTDILCPIGTV